MFFFFRYQETDHSGILTAECCQEWFLFLLHVSLIYMKVWGSRGIFEWSGEFVFLVSSTFALENNDEATLLSRTWPVFSHARPTELVKGKSSPLIPVEKAGDGAWLAQWSWGAWAPDRYYPSRPSPPPCPLQTGRTGCIANVWKCSNLIQICSTAPLSSFNGSGWDRIWGLPFEGHRLEICAGLCVSQLAVILGALPHCVNNLRARVNKETRKRAFKPFCWRGMAMNTERIPSHPALGLLHLNWPNPPTLITRHPWSPW